MVDATSMAVISASNAAAMRRNNALLVVVMEIFRRSDEKRLMSDGMRPPLGIGESCGGEAWALYVRRSLADFGGDS